MENEMIISEGAEREELIELPITTVLGEPVTSKPKAIDEEMVKKATEGDKVAFEKLFMATYGYVYLIAKKRLSHDEDIYDAIQETFTKVYKNLSRLSSAAAFLSWLKTITENTVTDILRKAPPETEEFFEEYAEVDENYNSKNFDREVSLDITEVLSNMSGDKVDLLIRVYYDGMTVTDIAKKEGVPKTTVYSRLAAAKKELKELLRIRGITKSMYGGSVVAMFATSIRNAIGTDLLSLAVAEEILHAVISGDKKRAAVIGTIARKQRNEAAMKIASGILVFCGVICALLVMTLYHLSGGFKFGVDSNDSLPEVGENSSEETVWDKLFEKDTSSDEISSNTTTSNEATSSETTTSSNNSLNNSSVNTSSNVASNSSSNISSSDMSSTPPPSIGDFVPDAPPTEDNVLGRQDANGFIATQRDWIYMSMGEMNWGYVTSYNNNNKGIWKLKKDGSEVTKISEINAYDINVVGDYIYFVTEKGIITKMRTDGTGSTSLSELWAEELVIVGNYAYFVSYGKKSYKDKGEGSRQQYYKMDLETLKTEVIIDDLVDYNKVVYWVASDKMFIIDYISATISRFYPETKKTELWYSGVMVGGIVTGGYYIASIIYNLQTKQTPTPLKGDDEFLFPNRAFYYSYDSVEKIAIEFSGSLKIYNPADMSCISHSYSFDSEHLPNMRTASNIYDGYIYAVDEDGHFIRYSIEGSDFKIYI